MSKLKNQPTPAPDPNTKRDKPTTIPRPQGISRASTATKHGHNHRLTLKQRNVVRYLMSPSKLNISASQASTIFNHIFRNRSVTPKMLREDWAIRKNRRGGNMYIDRIIKHAGTFTRKEIVASEEAVTHIRNACYQLDIELPEDVEMDEDLGDPTDSTVLHPTIPLSRLPRGVVDDYTFPIGYQPRPDDYVGASILWDEDDRSVRRRVMMCPGKGVHTRRQVNQNVSRTPSVEPRVVRNTLLPVAPGDSDDSDLEGQAEMRRIARTQSTAAEQQRYAQEQSRRNVERQKRAMISQGQGGKLAGGGLGRIEEEDDEEDADARGESDSEHGVDENNDGNPNAGDDQHYVESNNQFNLTDLLQRDDETRAVNNLADDSKSDQVEVVDNVSHQMRAISISDINDPPGRAATAMQSQQVKEDRYISPALNVMMSLPLVERVRIFRAAFPKLKDHEVSRSNFHTYAEIKDAWNSHRHHPKMFDLDDALKSPDSPMSPSYMPFRELWNGEGFNRPPAFSAIPPNDEIYQSGGPIMRVAVQDTETTEDIMICNNTFCSICSYLQSRPADGDPEYNLHGMPFVHTECLKMDDMAIIGAGVLTDDHFEAGGLRDLVAVPAKALYRDEPMEVLFLDGHRRAAVVCNPEKCKSCRV